MNKSNEIIDVYRLKIGVRSLQWNAREFLINGKPIYFRGFGRHEDSDVCKLVTFILHRSQTLTFVTIFVQ